MTFIEQFEEALAKMLESGEADTSLIVRWASKRVLESYRNGITADQKDATVKRHGEIRKATASRFSLLCQKSSNATPDM